MKNFDVLMSEDKQGTLDLIRILYNSKNKKAKMYFHSIAIFIIASLSLSFVYPELITNGFFWFVLASNSVFGLVLAFKAYNAAKGYKLIIDTHS